jgi:multidrug resistance efflux pump
VIAQLAQRVPVRIAIDTSQLPPGTVLAAGMTAAIEVHPRSARQEISGEPRPLTAALSPAGRGSKS